MIENAQARLGRINASVFANESDKGTWYSPSIDWVCKSGEGFKRVSRFPEQQLENVEVAIQRPKAWIGQQGG
jgi:hypothetical protein